MKHEELFAMNAAWNGRMIVAMLLALNIWAGQIGLALACLVPVCAAWMTDVLHLYGKPSLSSAFGLGSILSTVIVGVATCFAI